MTRDNSTCLILRTDPESEITLCLEPWGTEVRLAPGSAVEVRAAYESEGHFEIELSKGRITVFGWVGSVLTAYENGVEVA